MTNNPAQTRDRAEAKFKKMERAQDGVLARAEYEAEAVAVRERTMQLKSLRLAEEAADAAIEVKRKPLTRTRKFLALN